MARRTVSIERTRGVHPFAWHTRATAASVQVVRVWPNARGLWWSRWRSGSSKAVPRTGRVVLGREDFAARQPGPSAAKAWMALRTDRAVQPRLRAITAGVCPPALASRTWERPRVKASADRKPACNCARSAAVTARTKVVTGLIHQYSRPSQLRKDPLGAATRLIPGSVRRLASRAAGELIVR